MKRFLSLFVSVLLCVSSLSVLAEGSKQQKDMFKAILDEDYGGLVIETYEDEEFMAKTGDQITQLAESPSVLDYFGKMDEKAGLTVAADIVAILGEGDYVVNEFVPVRAFGASALDDELEIGATLLFATPYEIDEKYAVMIGLVKEEEVRWTAFEGVGVDVTGIAPDGMAGGIHVKLPAELVKTIEAEGGLVAIVQIAD